MQTKHATLVRIPLAMALGSLLVSCAQTKVPAEISGRLKGLRSEILMGRELVHVTTMSLVNLRDTRESNLRPHFDAYKQNLERLNSKAGGVGWVADMTAQQSEQYFKNWDAQINLIADKDLREAGEDRHEKAMKEYDKVRSLDAELRISFRTYMARLVDIRTMLSVDLTSQGQEKALPTINKSVDAEAEILSRIDAIIRQIDAMSST